MENKPTIGEVCREAYQIVKKPINYENAKVVGRNIMDFTLSYGKQLLNYSLAPYQIPTVVRKVSDWNSGALNEGGDSSASKCYGYLTGAISGVAVNICLMNEPIGLMSKPGFGINRALTALALTNLVSGSYELLRYARKRVVERKNLETSITEKE